MQIEYMCSRDESQHTWALDRHRQLLTTSPTAESLADGLNKKSKTLLHPRLTIIHKAQVVFHHG